MQEDELTGRCFRCLKSASLCVCGDLVPIDNRTHIQIIQHPRERGHPLGTARMAVLALARAELMAWGPRDGPAPLERLAARLPARTALLYPHPHARDVDDLAPEDRPDALIVLDGTWHHAHTQHRASDWLRSLPHLSVRPRRPSGYRNLRREPAEHCTSTVEAVVAALQALEPDTGGFARLIAAFDGMIDRQAPHADGRAQPRRRRRTNRESRAIPEALRDLSHLVVVYGECVTEDGPTTSHRHPVYWSAVRPETGEVFASYVPCEGFVPTDRQLVHMGLDRGGLDAAPPAADVHSAWSAFCRPGDRLVSWNQGSLDFVLAGTVPDRICLKVAWCNHHKSAVGHLDTVAEELGGAAEGPMAVAGRARLRLAQTLLVLDHLRGRLPGNLAPSTP